jgi:hypothetical protein
MNLQTHASQKQKSCKATHNPTHICSTFVFAPTHKEPTLYSTIKGKWLLLFLLTILFTGLTSFGQSFLGTITKQVNFREGPGTDNNVISSLKAGTQIFIVSLDTENDFYDIIDIRTNKEGYVHKSFIKIGKQIKENEPGLFAPSGETASYNPEVEIFNNTSLTLTLKLNDETYSFSPKEKKAITLSPGATRYRASAPGVIPNIGTEYLKSNEGYTWQFYIVTTYK